MKYSIIFMFFVLFAACSQYEPIGIENLTAKEFNQMIENEEIFVIDTHIPEQPHIEGTDAVIAFDKLEENVDKLPADKRTPIAVYCRSGSMSAEAAQTLQRLGYENIYNLLGGRNAYVEEFGE